MIPHLREQFNHRYAPEKYERFLAILEARCGTPIRFRNSETPCFFPEALVSLLVQSSKQILSQLFETPAAQAASERAVPEAFRVPGESPHPLFVQADFGLVRLDSGAIEPRLVEIQGFPSLYAFQPELSRAYREAYDLDGRLYSLPGGLTEIDYKRMFCRTVLGGHDPSNVVLLEINPTVQKTLPDFLLTSELCGIPVVDLMEVHREGRRLFYRRDGKNIVIHRIYNRVIVDELVRRQLHPPFDFRDDLDIEWAGHPNWFFRLSKFSLPFIDHPFVPRAEFLHRVEELPPDLENTVLKPLFSFSGLGVIVGPRREQIAAIPAERRSEYLLQQRVRFTPLIATPVGITQAEVRVMLIWEEEPVAVNLLIRTGRGSMMGVDQNRDQTWVGASAAFIEPA